MTGSVHNLQEEILPIIGTPDMALISSEVPTIHIISARGSIRGEGENPLHSLTGSRLRRLPSLINNFRFFKLIQNPA